MNFLFCNEKWHKLRNLILVLAVISTFSSTGYIGIVLLITYKMIFNNFGKKEVNYLGIFGIIMLLIVSVLIINSIFSQK